jgi:hypothetical protein
LRVLVWLGKKAKDSEKAVPLMLQAEDHLFSTTSHSSVGATINPSHQAAFKSLLSLDYWQRVWIIQELALNHNLTLFMYGSESFSREMIHAFCKICLKSEWGGHSSTNMSSDEMSFGLYSKLESLAYNVDVIVNLKAGADLDTILDMARKAQSLEQHDKLYGILSLLPKEVRDRIEPNYDLPVQEIFRTFALILLENTNRLDSILSWCVFKFNHPAPSWVPDWTVPFPRHFLLRSKQRQASRSRLSEWRMFPGVTTIRCRGIIVDTISDLGTSIQGDAEYRLYYRTSIPSTEHQDYPLPNRYGDKSALADALQTCLLFFHPFRQTGRHSVLDIPWVNWNISNSTYEQSSDSNYLRHFWEDIMRNVTSDNWWKLFDCFRQANANFSIFGYSFRNFFPKMLECGDNGIRLRRITLRSSLSILANTGIRPYRSHLDHHAVYDMKLAALAVRARRLATTATGYLGLVPTETELGDTIAVLFGCSFPVILRPHNDAFLVVGECCIPGLMDGETIDAEERGEFCAVDITIQ